MFLRCYKRKKNGVVHRYWSIVENHRLRGGKIAQRQVLYLGEINDSQKASWCRMLEAFQHGSNIPRQIALFPHDRQPPQELQSRGIDSLKVRLNELSLHRPRQWGACWLVLQIWTVLGMNSFWEPRLPPSRKGTPWLELLQILLCNRMIDPGAEWYIHRHWYRQTALADLLDLDPEAVPKNGLYHCLDKLLDHKDDLCKHLRRRWQDLFDAKFEVLLYDLTSTYFESDPPPNPEASKKRFGYSRDKRSDCVQVVIALVVTPEGFPLAYEVLAGNTQDKQTLREFLNKIETLYGKADRIWVMDRGIPTEEVLEEMRQSDPNVDYLVGTPKGRLSRYEKDFLKLDWKEVRPGVEVKLLQEDQEIYVLARSDRRVGKERSMRRRKLKRLWKRLGEIRAMRSQSRDDLLMRIGAAKKEAGRAYGLVEIELPKGVGPFPEGSLGFHLRREKLRVRRRHEGNYLLRAHTKKAYTPEEIWRFYIQLTEIEESFKTLKGDLAVRPIHHQLEHRIEAHIFVAFLGYCHHVTLRQLLRKIGGGLTPRAVLEKFATISMVDVHLPLEDGRQLKMRRYTKPDKDLQLLLAAMGMELPPQPPPEIESPTESRA
jgi:hypothetical protein